MNKKKYINAQNYVFTMEDSSQEQHGASRDFEIPDIESDEICAKSLLEFRKGYINFKRHFEVNKIRNITGAKILTKFTYSIYLETPHFFENNIGGVFLNSINFYFFLKSNFLFASNF